MCFVGSGYGEAPLSVWAEGGLDDLKQIRGIGSRLERTLNELGVYHSHQIAQFTASHVDWVDEHLRFKGRTQREGWAEQAMELAAGRPIELSRRYVSKNRHLSKEGK